MSHVGHSNDQLFLECNKAREMLYGALEMRNKALEMHVGDISNKILKYGTHYKRFRPSYQK